MIQQVQSWFDWNHVLTTGDFILYSLIMVVLNITWAVFREWWKGVSQ